MNIALDTETVYASDFSIRDLGNYVYTNDPRFNCYMLTAAYEDGRTWSGNPKDFDWASVNGHNWIMANAGFDLAVFARLQKDGIAPEIYASDIFDVLDLARYLGFPGNLAGAVETMLGKTLDKGTRDKAKGLQWADMTQEFQKEMTEYALRDSVVTLELWQKHGAKWPQWERTLSEMTRDMCAEGLPIDEEAVDTAVKVLRTELWKCRKAIPWAEDEATPALSKKLMAIECRKNHVEPPKSIAKTSEEFDAWLRQHGAELPFAKAMGQYRSLNMLLKKLETMRVRTVNGVMTYGLKYGGAHTLRDSGDAGLNVQNFSRMPVLFDSKGLIEDEETLKPLYKAIKTGGRLPDDLQIVDMRSMITAPEGKVFGVMDLSAIEPCALAWLAEDEEMLELLRGGMDPYEAQARITGRYSDPRPLKDVDFLLRQYMKVEVLGLGYGAGAEKAVVIAKNLAGLNLPLSESEKIVAKFRSRKYIPALWRKLEDGMRRSAGKDWLMELPSGRVMRYRDVKNYGSLSAILPRTGRLMRLKLWGGALCENCLAKDTQVLTNRGWVEIDKVAKSDLCWDGVEWVAHNGVISKGIQPIIKVHGVTATEDHKLFSKKGWVSAKEACSLDESMLEVLHYETQCQKSTEPKVQKFNSNILSRVQWEKSIVESSMRVWNNSDKDGKGITTEKQWFLLSGLPPVETAPIKNKTNTRINPSSAIRDLESYDRSLSPAQPPSLEKLRRTRYNGLRKVDEIRKFFRRHVAKLQTWTGFGAGRKQSRIQQKELSLGDSSTEFSQQKKQLEEPSSTTSRLFGTSNSKGDKKINSSISIEPRAILGSNPIDPSIYRQQVFDIKNCGPRHRFLIKGPRSNDIPMIAHNCVQATARDIFMWNCIKLRDAGFKIVARVHDEVVCLLNETTAKEDLKRMKSIMMEVPEWIPDLPLFADGHLCKKYTKG